MASGKKKEQLLQDLKKDDILMAVVVAEDFEAPDRFGPLDCDIPRVNFISKCVHDGKYINVRLAVSPAVGEQAVAELRAGGPGGLRRSGDTRLLRRSRGSNQGAPAEVGLGGLPGLVHDGDGGRQ